MMNPTHLLTTLAAAAMLAATTALPAAAQGGTLAMHTASSGTRVDRARELSTSLARGGYAVVVDLDENRLFFRRGDVVLWSAPIGTGTGLRLETEDQEWDFSTPRGLFHVQFKEENPVWIAPDWYYIENNLPVPPRDDPKRRFPGGLGAAAVYIGEDLAIHGTDKPELLGQQVSHGCIRLSDRDAQRLFHNVQIGTEVVIVGGERRRAPEAAKQGAKGNDPSTFSPGKKKPRPKDSVLARWEREDTGDLLLSLEEELWKDRDETRWTEVASLLLRRALDDDDRLALRGLMIGVGDLPSARVEREYATFLADAFSRAPLLTLGTLAELRREHRERAAAAIVAATAELYGGDLAGPAAPWPTQRVPRTAADGAERLGWNALARAERDLRDGSVAVRRSIEN